MAGHLLRRLTAVGLCLIPTTFGLQNVLQDELESLSPSQRARWIDIQKGKVSKEDVEIVLARYNEDVSWVEQYKTLVTVYNKGEDDLEFDATSLPNVGREGHTYLHHVANNYDNLADWTVFSQASQPTWGYAAGEDGGHMMSSTTFHDYVLQEAADSKFLFTSVMNITSLAHNLRTSYLSQTDIPRPVQSCPSWIGADDTWGKWIDLGFFKNFLSELQLSQTPVGHQALSPEDYWKRYVGELPEDKLVYFAQGAIFALSREQIHSKSKEHYQDLLAEVSGSSDPYQNYYNEWFWYYLFGGSHACAVPEEYKETFRSDFTDFSLTEARILQDMEDVGCMGGMSGISGISTPCPTAMPTEVPTETPTPAPTASPTPAPTASPSESPTASPTPAPTASPSESPTASPTPAPTASPSESPTASPTPAPTASPSKSPTASPTDSPTVSPTLSPTQSPTAAPTTTPTASPSAAPEREVILIDDYLQMCDVFFDCDANGERDDESPDGAESIGPREGLTDFTGLARIRFTSPQDLQAYDSCSLAFDASVQDDTCVNRGTRSRAESSQICRGSASDCLVMSTMCTLYGYSELEDYQFAFGVSDGDSIGVSSVPNMDYGACQPCQCDPIAILEGRERQIDGLLTEAPMDEAEAQLVGITTMTGFIAIADAYLTPTSPRYNAVLSPGRQAITQAIDEQGQGDIKLPFDLTDRDTLLSMFTKAEAIWQAQQRRLDSSQRRMQNGDDANAKLDKIATLTADLNLWYQENVEMGGSPIDQINLANQHAASRNLLIELVINPDTSELFSATIEGSEDGDPGVVDQALETINFLTFSPTPSPSFEDPSAPDDDGGDGGDNNAIIGGAVGAAGGGLLLVVLAVYYFQRSKNNDTDKAGKDNFNTMVTRVDDDDHSSAITPGVDGNLSGGGMKLAEQTHDDLPSATI